MSAAGGDKAREREKKRKPSLQGYAEAIKNAKAGVSALDAMVEEDQEDVYDVVDEDEYARIVDRRRKENDFVVDDGALLSHAPPAFDVLSPSYHSPYRLSLYLPLPPFIPPALLSPPPPHPHPPRAQTALATTTTARRSWASLMSPTARSG